MDAYKGLERRKSQRAQVSFIVFYRVDAPVSVRMMVGDRNVNAIALDISEGGLAVTTEYNIPTSTVVTVRFIMLTQDPFVPPTRAITVPAEVCYATQTERRSYRLGVRFVSLAQADRAFVSSFISAKH